MTPQAVLIDTNVISYLYRNNAQAQPYRLALLGRRGLYSFQTYAELRVWSANWSSPKRAHLERWLQRHFGFLAHTPDVTEQWIKATLSAKRNGYPIAAADAWIAATAINSGLLLLTADKNDFLGVDGLKLLAV
jgi:predicted nucleic acid-binding protein